MRVLRIIVSIFVTIIFIAATISYTCVASVEKTIMNKEVITKSITNSNVSDDIQKEVDEAIDEFMDEVENEVKEQIIAETKKETNTTINIEEYLESKEVQDVVGTVKIELGNVLKKFNTKENINEIINYAFEIAYEQEEISFTEESINDKIREIMEKIMKENYIKLSKEAQVEIDSFIDELSVALNEGLVESFSGSEFVDEENEKIINPIPVVKNTIKTISYVLILVIVVQIVMILSINLKHIDTGTIFVSIGLIISAIIVKSIKLVIEGLNIIKLIKIDGSLAEVVENVIKEIVKVINNFGTGYLIAGCILIAALIAVKIRQNRPNNSN